MLAGARRNRGARAMDAMQTAYAGHLQRQMDFALLDQKRYRQMNDKAKLEGAQRRIKYAAIWLHQLRSDGFGHQEGYPQRDNICECPGCQNWREAQAIMGSCDCGICAYWRENRT